MKRVEIPLEDKELAETAKRLAGGPTKLAERFGVTTGAASQWGQTRKIPRHMKEQLARYIAASGGKLDAAGKAKSLWQMEGVRDHRWFTSLVEDLRRIDRMGHGKAWITAWTTVKAAAQILRTLDDADDETHWKAIFGEDGPPIDHWKRLTGRTELSLTEKGEEE